MTFRVKKWSVSKYLSWLCLTVFFAGSSNANSPWVQPRGEFITRFDLSYIPAYTELFVDEKGPSFTERKITDATLQIFSEYGIYQGGSLARSIPLKRVEAGDLVNPSNPSPTTSSGNLVSSGNVRLLWKQAILDWDTKLSGQLLVEFPSGAYDTPTGLRSGYNALAIVPSISFGAGTEKYYYFAYLGIGYRNNKYSSFLKNGVEGGYQISQNIWLAGVLDLLYSFEDGDRADPAANLLTGLYVNDQEYLAWGIKLFGDINPNWGISGAIYGAVSGNLVPKAPLFNMGVYYRIR
jgi:hypothetical protein